MMLSGMNGQPCMVLQSRYFQLLDVNRLQQPTASVEDVSFDQCRTELGSSFILSDSCTIVDTLANNFR